MGTIFSVDDIRHHQSAASHCEVGDSATLIPHPGSRHGENTIQVLVHGRMIGHVPRKIATQIAKTAPQTDYRARVVARLGGSDGYLVGLRIELPFEIDLIQSRQPKQPVSSNFHSDRATRLLAYVDDLKNDRDFFPSEPSLAYELTELLVELQSKLESGEEPLVSDFFESLRGRLACQRGVFAWRMLLLAAWWRQDERESQRLAALLVAYVTDTTSCHAANRFVADTRIMCPEQTRSRIDAETAALRVIDKASNSDEGKLRVGRSLLKPESAIRSVAESAGIALSFGPTSASFFRLLADIVGHCNDEDLLELQASGVLEDFASRIGIALQSLPIDSSLDEFEARELRRLTSGDTWHGDDWQSDPNLELLLLRLSGELGDADADFTLAMRLQTNSEGQIFSKTATLLSRAEQRGDPSTKALAALAAIARLNTGHSFDSSAGFSSWFLDACENAGQPQLGFFKSLPNPQLLNVSDGIEALDGLVREWPQCLWAEVCRNVAICFPEPVRTRIDSLACSCERLAIQFPSIGCAFAAFAVRIGALQKRAPPLWQDIALRIIRRGMRFSHPQSASILLAFLRTAPECAESGEVAAIHEKIAARGTPSDAAQLAWKFARGEELPKDEAKASAWFFRAALGGHADSQCNYGFRLLRGIGVAADPATSIDWFQRSAEAGSAVAAYNLGCVYSSGTGVAQDLSLGFSWFLRAATSGHLNAIHAVAERYRLGHGVPCNYEQAVAWASRLRERADPRGSLILGQAHLEGHGVSKDEERAEAFLRESAGGGNPAAALALARLYGQVEGREPDPVLEFQWLSKAAELKEPEAMFEVAMRFRLGKGVERSEEKWQLFAEQAADAGCARAAFALSQSHIGKNTADSDSAAVTLLLQCLRRGDEAALAWLLELLAWSKIGPEAIAEHLIALCTISIAYRQTPSDLIATSILQPFKAGVVPTGLLDRPKPAWQAIKGVSRSLDIATAQRRAVALVETLARLTTAESRAILASLRKEAGFDEESQLIFRGEIDLAWSLRTSLHPNASRLDWEASHSCTFSDAAYVLLETDGPSKLPLAQTLLSIAARNDSSGIARFNLAVANIVAKGEIEDRSMRLISESAKAGCQEAQEIDRLIRDCKSSFSWLFALGGTMLVLGAILMAVHSSNEQHFSPRSLRTSPPGGIGFFILWFGVLLVAAGFAGALIRSVRFGSNEANRINSAAVSTHLGCFVIPCPHRFLPHLKQRVDLLSSLDSNSQGLQTRFRDRRRFMVKRATSVR